MRSYTSVINACAQGGQVEEAVKWLQPMQDQGIKPNDKSYNSIINACAQGGQVEQAVKWLQAMKDQGYVSCRRRGVCSTRLYVRARAYRPMTGRAQTSTIRLPYQTLF